LLCLMQATSIQGNGGTAGGDEATNGNPGKKGDDGECTKTVEDASSLLDTSGTELDGAIGIKGPSACFDGVDNDLDGFTDFEDVNCFEYSHSTWTIEKGPVTMFGEGAHEGDENMPSWWNPFSTIGYDGVCGDDSPFGFCSCSNIYTEEECTSDPDSGCTWESTLAVKLGFLKDYAFISSNSIFFCDYDFGAEENKWSFKDATDYSYKIFTIDICIPYECEPTACSETPINNGCGGEVICNDCCKTCGSLHAECGYPSNNCGGTLSCGECSSEDEKCVNNKCVDVVNLGTCFCKNDVVQTNSCIPGTSPNCGNNCTCLPI
ncbi:hypothetical protein ACFLTH_16890, partial [Bacteroidota bacterium]